MKNYKKTLIGSIIMFALGTSCCWISSLAVWFGGVVFIGVISSFIENSQSLLLLTSSFLAIVSIYFYFRNKKLRENKG